MEGAIGMNNRQIDILYLVLEHPKGITGTEISKEIEVTTRTVRSDIAFINSVLSQINCSIHSNKQKGYFVVESDFCLIRNFLKQSTMKVIKRLQVIRLREDITFWDS